MLSMFDVDPCKLYERMLPFRFSFALSADYTKHSGEDMEDEEKEEKKSIC